MGICCARNAISYPRYFLFFFFLIQYVFTDSIASCTFMCSSLALCLDVTKVPNHAPLFSTKRRGEEKFIGRKRERDTKSSVMLSWRVERGFCPSHLWRTVTPSVLTFVEKHGTPHSPAPRSLSYYIVLCFFACLFGTICLSYRINSESSQGCIKRCNISSTDDSVHLPSCVCSFFT